MPPAPSSTTVGSAPLHRARRALLPSVAAAFVRFVVVVPLACRVPPPRPDPPPLPLHSRDPSLPRDSVPPPRPDPPPLPPSTTVPEHPTSEPSLLLSPTALRVVRGDVLVATLAPDGMITVAGAPYARMEARRVVAQDGRTLAAVSPDGTVRFEGAARDGRLRPDGAIEAPDGQRMSLREDGHVLFTHPAHPDDPVVLRLRVEGVTDRTRATAMVLVGLLMFRDRATAAAH